MVIRQIEASLFTVNYRAISALKEPNTLIYFMGRKAMRILVRILLRDITTKDLDF